ncbi:sulfatase family protein [Pelagicoccus mobilis]|uniref:Sulfatase n=1 Tax=Pelagicoccus mobilis TaxID=415221 RepID=A0A934RVP7_9BACT|nr:sulfatase [Pelagicoccus mobilis]MBK1878575.1 sulfatase [Pelagicoccus mobilis]
MKIRIPLVFFVALASACSVLVGEARKPNILWIFPEDMSPFLGCYGDPINAGHTPAIDRLAASGVRFERAYVSAPVCSASRSAIITGVMQTTTGTQEHRSSRWTDGEVVPAHVRIHLPEGMKTIPELMKEAGYFTFNNGKDDYNFHYDRRALYDIGTEESYVEGMNGWQGNKSPHGASVVHDVWSSRPDKDQPWFGQLTLRGGKGNNRFVREGELLADKAVPLPPYFPDTPAHRKAWTAHYNAVRGTDAEVETVMSQLEADGELENTIVFFFSDHGSNHSLRHKQFCYEGGVHVPLIVAGGHAAIGEGVVRSELVSGLDISATTLALAGAKMPDYLDGQNLFSPEYEEREFVISARDRCDFTIDQIRTVRTDTYRYIRNYFPERTLSQPQYRDKSKVVLDMRRLHAAGALTDYQEEHWFGLRPEEELYDIEKDPHQVNNLAKSPEFAAQLERHRKILEDWIAETGDLGQADEADVQLEATYNLWKDREQFRDQDTNPEYDKFRGK